MTDPARLLESVQWRVDRYTRHGDAQAVLEPAAVHELVELIPLSLTPEGIAVDGIQAAAWLSWCRYHASGSPVSRAHAGDLFRQLASVRPDLVPSDITAEPIESPNEVFENARRMLQHGVSTQDTKLVEGAVRVLAELAELANPASRPIVYASLGGALLDLYHLTGTAAVLDEAITVLEQAEPTPQTRGALGAALIRRGDPHGPEILRALLAELDPREQIAIAARFDLADAAYTQAREHWRSYSAGQSRVELTRAVTCAQEVLELVPDEVRPREFLSMVLVERSHLLGSAVDAFEAARVLQDVPGAESQFGVALNHLAEYANDPAPYVAEAERVLLIALERATTDDDDEARASALSGLGDTYRCQQRLDESIEAQREALRLTRDPERKARVAANLAAALGLRSEDDDPERMEVLTSTIDGAPPATRAMMTMALADLHRRHRSPEALPLYRRGAQDAALTNFGRVYAANMWASLAIFHDDVPESLTAYGLAIDLLQLVAWRGLWRFDQQRELARMNGIAPEAAAVALVAGQPRLAVEWLERGRSVLWAQLRSAGSVPEESGSPDLASTQARMEDAVSLPPVEPGSWDVDVPAVVINISHRRCDAILLPSYEVVPLDCTFDEVSERARTLQGVRSGSGTSYPAAQETVVEVLEWTWHRIVRPVLDRVAGERVWWCPTGPATLLPLHAAGDYRGTGESALDRVVSSYTTTLSSLAGEESGGEGMLVVGASDLPGVADEVAAVAARFPGCTTLVGAEATVARVRAEIGRHARVHIACHGKQNLRDPSQSHLVLADGPLTVGSLLDLRVSAEFAFLSACEASASTHLPDESIHLAAAVRYAGFRHVIATLWTMEDWAGPAIASGVYGSTGNPAAALHEAVNRLRAARPYEPTAWAPFIHIGP